MKSPHPDQPLDRCQHTSTDDWPRFLTDYTLTKKGQSGFSSFCVQPKNVNTSNICPKSTKILFADSNSCVLIVGVTREDIPRYEVLDAVFEKSPRQLLPQCLILRDKFGFRDSSRLFKHWIGDDSRFVSVEENFNQGNKEEPRHGIFTNSPPDFDKPNADELYIDTLRSLSAEGRVVIPARFHEVRDSLQGMTLTDTKLADFPAAAALGYALHDLETVKPWLNTIRSFTMDDGF